MIHDATPLSSQIPARVDTEWYRFYDPGDPVRNFRIGYDDDNETEKK